MGSPSARGISDKSGQVERVASGTITGLKGEGQSGEGGGQLKATMKGSGEFVGGMHKNTILASVLSL